MSPMDYAVCFAIGFGLAGVLYWIVLRAIDRGWWPWLDRFSEDGAKGLLFACIAMAGAWISVFAWWMANTVQQ